MEAIKKGYHFVLVHGACHGAWCWYKLKPLLEASGHRVTSIDLAASGINPKSIKEIKSFSDYSEPLIEVMSSLPSDEKVILVGHSLGGLSLGFVMDKFPKKVLVGVFLAAFMPDCVNKPSYVLHQLMERTPTEAWMDTKFKPFGTPEEPLTSLFFGFDYMTYKQYQLCSIQGYGSVKRVYVVCGEDLCIPTEFQWWMIDNGKLNKVKEIKGADHMPMLCKPHELCDCLLEIANE